MDTSILRTTSEKVAGGDPYVSYAAEKHYGCSWCFGSYLTITIEEDGQERDEAVPCRRCNVEDL